MDALHTDLEVLLPWLSSQYLRVPLRPPSFPKHHILLPKKEQNTDKYHIFSQEEESWKTNNICKNSNRIALHQM